MPKDIGKKIRIGLSLLRQNWKALTLSALITTVLTNFLNWVAKLPLSLLEDAFLGWTNSEVGEKRDMLVEIGVFAVNWLLPFALAVIALVVFYKYMIRTAIAKGQVNPVVRTPSDMPKAPSLEIGGQFKLHDEGIGAKKAEYGMAVQVIDAGFQRLSPLFVNKFAEILEPSMGPKRETFVVECVIYVEDEIQMQEACLLVKNDTFTRPISINLSSKMPEWIKWIKRNENQRFHFDIPERLSRGSFKFQIMVKSDAGEAISDEWVYGATKQDSDTEGSQSQ